MDHFSKCFGKIRKFPSFAPPFPPFRVIEFPPYLKNVSEFLKHGNAKFVRSFKTYKRVKKLATVLTISIHKASAQESANKQGFYGSVSVPYLEKALQFLKDI